MLYKPRDINKDGEYDNIDNVERIQAGMGNFSNYRDEFFQPVDKDYDRMTGLQTGIIADQIGKDMDMARSEQQAERQSELYKDNSLFGANLDMRNQLEGRADEFKYGMRSLDKQFELTDEYSNRDYGRNIGMLAATGEQGRKNVRAQGVEDRLGTITAGEQERLGIAATGDQTRRNYRVEGDETRKVDTNRINTEGVNEREGYRVLGDQTRKTDTNRINTEGVNEREGYRVLGDQTRQTDTNRITTQGSEDRKNYEFEDNINARGEARNKSRARGLARNF